MTARWLWLKADFAQQEARIFAAAAHEETMIAEFNGGGDVYSNIGTELYERVVSKIAAPQERFYAKTFFLAKIYGAGASKLVQIDPRLTLQQAQRGVDRFGERYRRVDAYYAEQSGLLRDQGYAITLFGRKRWLPELSSGDRKLRDHALRQGVNHPIQGTAADILKLTLVRVDDRLDSAKGQIILTVHDELDLRVTEDYVDDAKRIITASTAEVGEMIGLTLPVEFGVGPTWADA